MDRNMSQAAPEFRRRLIVGYREHWQVPTGDLFLPIVALPAVASHTEQSRQPFPPHCLCFPLPLQSGQGAN